MPATLVRFFFGYHCGSSTERPPHIYIYWTYIPTHIQCTLSVTSILNSGRLRPLLWIFQRVKVRPFRSLARTEDGELERQTRCGVYIGIPTWPKVFVLKSRCLDVPLKLSTKATEDRYVGVSIELEVSEWNTITCCTAHSLPAAERQVDRSVRLLPKETNRR